jgi:hypothetical protein
MYIFGFILAVSVIFGFIMAGREGIDARACGRSVADARVISTWAGIILGALCMSVLLVAWGLGALLWFLVTL